MGDVYGVYPRQDPLAGKFVYRYAAGTSVELLSIALINVSPVWVLAAQTGEALKAAGLIEADAETETMDQLLDGLERTSTHLALTVNMPPLDVPTLRAEWRQFRENVATLPAARLPKAPDVERAWSNLRSTSRELNRSVFSVSAAMGMSAVSANLQWLSRSAVVAARTTGTVVGGAFLEHYALASKELRKAGFVNYCARYARPYLVAAIRNFLPENKSWTERLLSD